MKKEAREYWNPFLETLPAEKLAEIELKNFRRHLAYSKEHSLLCKEKFRDVHPGRHPEQGRPSAASHDRQGRPACGPVGGGVEHLREAAGGGPLSEVSDYRQTSGTTGKPVYVPESFESWTWRVEVWCHILWMAGFRETDRVFVPFGYNVYVAFWEGHYAAEKVGCEVVPGGALDTQGRINKMREVKATALMNTPTYGLHMAEEAEAMGVDPKKIGIRRMQCAGEPMPPATRKMLEQVWGAEVYDHIGGTEPCAWAAMCRERNGLHILEPFFLVEILDMETQTREVKEGELGVAVVTPLGRRSFPLIRFNTKDVVRKGIEPVRLREDLPDDCGGGRPLRSPAQDPGRAVQPCDRGRGAAG